jgi:predicted ATP-dependent serine protease
MADAPWRCSECGTINEPVANSCRTCGRWPSLFDLQESVVDEASTPVASDRGAFEVGTFEPETVAPEPFQPEAFEVEELPEEVEEQPDSASDRRRRVVTSLILPLAFVVYIVISIVFGDRGSG